MLFPFAVSSAIQSQISIKLIQYANTVKTRKQDLYKLAHEQLAAFREKQSTGEEQRAAFSEEQSTGEEEQLAAFKEKQLTGKEQLAAFREEQLTGEEVSLNFMFQKIAYICVFICSVTFTICTVASKMGNDAFFFGNHKNEKM